MNRPNASQIAINAAGSENASAQGRALALNAEGGAPEWAQLLPAGPNIQGRDGRSWTLKDVNALVAAFAAHSGPLAIDWEHAQDRLAPQGKEAPAAGWVEAMEARDGELWGRVSWTPKAAQSIADKEYRFLSPVFSYRPETNEIVALLGAGLVNRPNLVMAALNSQQGETPMDKELLKALGLSESATLADALNAIAKMKEQVAINSDLSRFVPRADFDKAIERALNAERTIEDGVKAAREKEIADLVDGAVKAGKVAPANKEFYVASCRAEGGVERFKEFVAKAESKFEASGLDKKPADGGGNQSVALNAEQKSAAAMLGLDEEALAKHIGVDKKSA